MSSTQPSSCTHAKTTHSAENSKRKKSSWAKSDGTAAIQKIPMNHDIKDPCTITCLKAQGQVLQLQCSKWLCLHHHECVGLNQYSSEYRTVSNSRGKQYICEACVPKSLQKSASVSKSSSTSSISTKSTLNVGDNRRPENKFPQTIAVVKGNKYVIVAKPLLLPNERVLHVNDIENDLKQINESIRKNRKQSNNSLDGSYPAHNSQAVEHSNKLFATNIFANDLLLCILKYLKIHDPRAVNCGIPQFGIRCL